MADFKQSREVNWTITVKNEGTEETTTYSVNGKRSVADCLREALALEEHPTITKKAGELTVKLDVDASDAITALKAIQREARKATQALREFESEASRLEAATSEKAVEDMFRRWRQDANQALYGHYEAALKKLCGDSYSEDDRFKTTNRIIYDAYANYDGDYIELYFKRCSGVSTSIEALQKAFGDVVYLKPWRPFGKTSPDTFTDKVVFTENDVELPRNVKPRKHIHIVSVDYTDDEIFG